MAEQRAHERNSRRRKQQKIRAHRRVVIAGEKHEPAQLPRKLKRIGKRDLRAGRMRHEYRAADAELLERLIASRACACGSSALGLLCP